MRKLLAPNLQIVPILRLDRILNRAGHGVIRTQHRPLHQLDLPRRVPLQPSGRFRRLLPLPKRLHACGLVAVVRVSRIRWDRGSAWAADAILLVERNGRGGGVGVGAVGVSLGEGVSGGRALGGGGGLQAVGGILRRDVVGTHAGGIAVEERLLVFALGGVVAIMRRRVLLWEGHQRTWSERRAFLRIDGV
ncbi:hypothetical protein P152DRAFT_290089 [Eremomyces bilateralis CBS 781.70]|uniref:Uncharacterized protein n=1 Tax=Eremomyces bilateralis CBS 781.70 TaxID=1392243 RepID=A0A6G1G765_9PEZI|nr:uncharacterized protein P152DRAFT_290089 [Eremomyces bilateralis CBS 781.70]KAF1813740.1 hypothetical protein P152DRAFT_290089 [Eremomyces bilateralis CBS 781.70]